MKSIWGKLHRERATGAVLPDVCGSGFFYNTWITQHNLKKYMHLLINKSTLKCVNNITHWNILRKKRPWARIRLHDTWFHGTRCEPPGAGAPVRAARQCSAGLFGSMILTVLNAFLKTHTYGNYTNFIWFLKHLMRSLTWYEQVGGYSSRFRVLWRNVSKCAEKL